MRSLIVVLALLSIAAPSATAYRVYADAGVSGVNYSIRDTLSGEAALELRRTADDDHDGVVTKAEADHWWQNRPGTRSDPMAERACLGRFNMVEAPGFKGTDVMFMVLPNVAGAVDARPMPRLVQVTIWGSGIDVGTPVTIHFDRRANLVDLLKCTGAVDADPFPAGRPERVEIEGGFDSWDIGEVGPTEVSGLRELMGVDNANIPQYWILADTPEEVDLLYTHGVTYRNKVEMQGLQGWIVGNAYVLLGAGGALAVLAAMAFLTEIG